MNRGIIYVMWNELFPELVKIGVTQGHTSADVEKRRKELSHGENMPQPYEAKFAIPYEAKFAICVNNYEKIESVIHKSLNKLRHNPHREFFKLSVDEAISLLSSYIISGGAVEVPIKNSFLPEEKKAIKNLEKQRSAITFRSLDIHVGTTLTFISAPQLKVKTYNDSRRVVLPNGETTTLSIAAKRLRDQTKPKNGIKGLPDGAKDFAYRGKSLWELSLDKQRNYIEA